MLSEWMERMGQKAARNQMEAHLLILTEIAHRHL